MSNGWVRFRVVGGVEAFMVSMLSSEYSERFSRILMTQEPNGAVSVAGDEVRDFVDCVLDAGGIFEPNADVEGMLSDGMVRVIRLPNVELRIPQVSESPVSAVSSSSEYTSGEVGYDNADSSAVDQYLDNVRGAVPRLSTTREMEGSSPLVSVSPVGATSPSFDANIGKIAPVRTAGFRRELDNIRKEVVQKVPEVDDLVIRVSSFLLGRNYLLTSSLKDEIVRAYSKRQELMRYVIDSSGIGFINSFLNQVMERVSQIDVKSEFSQFVEAYSNLFGESKESMVGSFEQVWQRFKSRVSTLVYEFSPDRVVGNRSIRDAIKELVSVDVMIRGYAETVFDILNNEEKVIVERVREMLSVIRGFDFVTGLELSAEGYLVVTYKDVEIRVGNMLYGLGPYKFCIRLSDLGSNSGNPFKIYNVERRSVCSYQHPHVTHDGNSICWGNIKEGVYKLYADFNLPVLISVVWNYLNSYNPNDRFIAIDQLFSNWGLTPITVEESNV